MDVGLLIGFVVSFVVSSLIVNTLYRMYMKLTGADMMFFSRKKKLVFITLLALFLLTCIMKLFGFV